MIKIFSMKKIAVFFFCLILFLPQRSFSFWIWSPKTNKWKNPKISPKPTPAEQFQHAKKFFDIHDYSKAIKEFQKVVKYFKGSKEAGLALYYIGLSFENLKKDLKAFKVYKKLLESYPFFENVEEVYKRLYEIGERLEKKKLQRFLGVELKPPALLVFKTLAEVGAYSEYAAKALYKEGIILMGLNRFLEAQKCFEKIIEEYPDSDWIKLAKFQLALCNLKKSPKIEYDQGDLESAEKLLKEFLSEHPQEELAKVAEKELKFLREKMAEKNYKIAQFYESQRKFKSAKIYYKYIIKNFPETEWAKKSKERIGKLP